MMSSSSKKNTVVVVGSANSDLVSYTSNLPQMGETVMGARFETSCGGKGANQAVAAACLDISPVHMVCRVGQDSFGQDLLSNFRRFNVQYDESTTILQDSSVSTGVADIVVDTSSGDNMIIVIPGANFQLTPQDVQKEISTVKPSVVVVQLEITPETALEALKAAKEVGATTILNTAPAPVGWTLDEFLPYCDVLIPNETELKSICGGGNDDDEESMAKSLLNKGVGKAVLVTLGARGAMIVDQKATTLVDAPSDLPCKSDPVVDTIGAGDAFCGALSTYLSAGLELQEAATKACGVASMSVRKQGAQVSYPTADDLPDCLKL